MKRRAFIRSSLAAGISGSLAASCGGERLPWEVSKDQMKPVPVTIAGMTLEDLREDYRHRLFDLYLPFWDKGGYDQDLGGFMCILNDDGSVVDDEKQLMFQGHAIWVYSFLYNNLGQDTHHLEIAQKTRDFMVRYMKSENGTWYERVYRDGRLKEGVGNNICSWLFAANGLGELYKATKNEEDQKTVIDTIWAALRAYDNPGYSGVLNYGGLSPDVSLAGFRELGHSMVVIWLLSQFLTHTRNRKFEEILDEHISLVMEKFFNPKLGISNEYLKYDYSRIPGYDDYMLAGVSIETMWIIMLEAIRSKNPPLFEDAKNTIKRYLEITWDYVFEGLGGEHFYVFDGPGRTREKLYGIKSMRSHCELMIALLHILEYTGESWAQEWYERVRIYSIQRFATDYGVWRQTVDRFGKEIKPVGILEKTRDIYHQSRWLMLNLLCLDRLIDQKGNPSPQRT